MTPARLVWVSLRLAGLFYLASLVLALVPTLVTMLGVSAIAGARPWRIELLGPDWLNVTAEAVGRASSGAGVPGLAAVWVGTFLLVPTVMLFQVGVYSFLAGGVLERLAAGDGPRPPFWAACRRWFGPFLRLGLVGLVVLGALGTLGIAVSWLLGGLLGPDVPFVLNLVAQSIALGWLELGRAVMVLEDRRSATSALGQAARFGANVRAVLLWLLLAALQGGLLFIAAQPPEVEDPYAVATLLQALAFGQLLAFLGAWLKVGRLAVALHLARAAQPAKVGAALAARR